MRKPPMLLVVLLAAASCKDPGPEAPSITALDRTTHQPRFPIAAGNHAETDCNACHGAFDTFTRFTCTASGCHEQAKVDPAHKGLADYAFEDERCLSCHPSGEVPPFDHTRFPIGEGTTHPERTCGNCHKSADRKQFDCLSCHEHAQPAMDGAHGSMPDYVWESARCYQCHPDGKLPPFDHGWFPIGEGATHPDRTCSGCHPVVADRKQFTCTACHSHPQAKTDADHAGIPDYAYESARCLQCHPDGRGGSMDHVRYFPIAAGDAHDPVSCGECHTDPATRKVTTCNVCHSHTAADMAPRHAAVWDFSPATGLCLRCHADSQVNRVAAHLPFRIGASTEHGEERTGCLECHPALRADKPYGADFSLAALDCLSCHERAEMDDRHQGESGYQYQSQSCIKGGCHDDGDVP